MPIAFKPTEQFVDRHIGPDPTATASMLEAVGCKSIQEFAASVIPATLRIKRELDLGEPLGEAEFLREARRVAALIFPTDPSSEWGIMGLSCRP